MVDYSVDESFDLHFTENRNFVTVDGRTEFEQDLVIQIHHRFSDMIGDYKQTQTLTEKVKLITTRLAKEFEIIDSIKYINISEPIDKPDTLSIEIVYRSGEIFEETL